MNEWHLYTGGDAIIPGGVFQVRVAKNPGFLIIQREHLAHEIRPHNFSERAKQQVNN